MSQSEKRYFKLYAMAGNGSQPTVALRLFEYLQKKGAWIESEIAQEFAGESFLKQLNVVRTRLQQQILEALSDHDQGKSIQLEFARRFNEVDVLSRRKLIDACKRTVIAALRHAERLDLPSYAQQAVTWLLRLERQFAGPDLNQRLQRLHDTQKALLRKINEEIELVELQDQMLCLLPQNSIPDLDNKREADALLQKVQTKYPQPEALAFDAKLIYYHLLSYYALIHGSEFAYYDACKQLIETWESLPDRIRMEEERYFRALLTFAESATKTEEAAVVRKSVAKLKRILEGSTSLRPVESLRIYNLELRFLAERGEWALAIALVPDIQSGLKKFKQSINQLIRLSLLSNAIVTLFVCERWQQIYEWALLLEHVTGHQASPSLQGVMRAVRWVADYELHDHESLEKALRPLLKTTKAAAQNPIAQAFADLLNCKSVLEEKNAFAALAAIIQTDPSTGILPHLDLLGTWANARLKGITLVAAEAARR